MALSGLLSRSLVLILLLVSTVSARTLDGPRTLGGSFVQTVSYGTYVYYANGVSLDVWNFIDSSRPDRHHMTVEPLLPGPIAGIAISGDFLFLEWYDPGTQDGAIRTYSLADPVHPALLNETAMSPVASILLSIDHYLYAIDGFDSFFKIFDVSDPAHPVSVGTLAGFASVPGATAHMAGDRIYLHEYFPPNASRVHVIDIANPAHPSDAGVFTIASEDDFAAATDSGYVMTVDAPWVAQTMTIYDARDPATATAIATLPLSGATDAALRGNDLYLFGAQSLAVWDFSSPTQPALVTSAGINTTGVVTQLSVPSGFVVTRDNEQGVLIDATRPTQPLQRSTFPVPSGGGNFTAATVDDRYAYIAGGAHPLDIVDKTTLERAGFLASSGNDDTAFAHQPHDIALSGSGILIRTNSEIYSIDISNPAHPVVLNRLGIDTASFATANGRAYVDELGSRRSLTVIDVRNPQALEKRGAINGLYAVMAAAGNLAYVYANDPQGNPIDVRIVDASDLDHPTVLGSFAHPCADGRAGPSLATNADGTVIAIGCYSGGVEFIDARYPVAPRRVGSLPASDASDITYSLAAHGPYFYLGKEYSIDEVDASDPHAPQLSAHYPTASLAHTIATSAEDGSLLAQILSTGVYVYDCRFDCEAAPPPPPVIPPWLHRPSGHSVHRRPQ